MLKCKSLVAVSLTVVLAACSWVKVTEEATDVTVAKSPEMVKHCERIGNTTSQGVVKLGFIERDKKKVAEELITLAKNTAVDMGGNAILAEGEIKNASQTFGVYKCN